MDGICSHPNESARTPCDDPADTECDNPDTCNGSGLCLDDFEAQGTSCGDVADDQCDNPDICDGSGACDDNFETDGTPCDDADICTGNDACDTGVCAGTLIPQASNVEAMGPRYLAVTPQPGGSVAAVALLVTSPDWPCLSKYIDENGRLVTDPVFQFPDDWGTIKAKGVDIVPSSTYNIVAECGEHASPPGSDTTWLWGDVAGRFIDGAWTPGNGVVDIRNFMAVVEGFQQLDTAPPLEWTDLHPCTPEPDGVINVTDMTYVVDAFRGFPYPCPVPCP
ncbi:MAG: hypothetical protein JSU86_13345 [Phycisphaerales bacterium]|nr:MAG: hypothetical protein JSU86_13345 [Phycisphaerales bacterium]